MSDYDFIIVESFYPINNTGRHGLVHIRPLPNQEPYLSKMFVECSKDLSNNYPVGTKFRRAKTKRTTKNISLPIMVPLDENLLYIIKKRGNKSKKKEDYILPILKYGLTPKEEYDHIKTFVRNTNKRLTRVGVELELSLKVTSYVTRQCFATIQKNNNAPLAYISEALGHSNLKTTQNYFGRFEDEGLKAFHSGLMAGMVE